MANYVDYSYSSDSSESEYSEYSSKPQCLNFAYAMINSTTLLHNLEAIACECGSHMKSADYYESLILRHNRLAFLPDSVAFFTNLRLLDLSNNNLSSLPDSVVLLKNLTSLIVKNNQLVDNGIPKNLGVCKTIREVNLSGNNLTRFPDQILELDDLKFLYMGGNKISVIPNAIGRLRKYGQYHSPLVT